MNPSIQRRLSLYLSIVILIAGVVAGGLSYFLAFRDATHSQDAQLVQVASALSRGSFKDAAPSKNLEEEASVDDFFVVGIGGNAEAKGGPPTVVKLRADIGIGLQTILDRGAAWRVVVTRDSDGEKFGVVQSLEARAEDARDSARLTLIPIALLIPLLLVSVHLALKTLFSPLGQLSREVDGVTGASLVAITEDRVPREFVPFIQAVNRLLQRLGQAMAQQGRFVADAAHEMRSPVAALMLQAENLEHCDLSTEAGQRLALLRSGLARMAALQDQLLRFARAQTPSVASPQVIDLDIVVRRAIEDLLPTARAKSIDVGCSLLEAVRVLGELRHHGLAREERDRQCHPLHPIGGLRRCRALSRRTVRDIHGRGHWSWDPASGH